VLRAAEFLATLGTGLFAGAALYVNLAEHPARMSRDTRVALEVWAPSYALATRMQAPLAIVSLRALLASGRDPASADTRALLVRWGRLHAVRSVLGLLALVLMAWTLAFR
jgi:hypothetical protein